MYNKKLLIHPELPPLNTDVFDELRANINVPDCRKLDLEEFKKDAVNHFKNTTVNKLSGFDSFPQHDIIAGCQQYIDNLISKNGLDGLQIFEHDYHYYKTLNPAIKYTTVDTLHANKPLLIAMPFPGHLGTHRQMENILKICNEKNIDVHIDCAWLVSAFDIYFDFDQPCIKSFAMSLSKAYSLHWNKVGIRWSRKTDTQDTVTILNKTNAVSRLALYVARQYMERFPIDYLCKKYKYEYFKICKELKLRPSNIIHACFSIDRQFLYGLQNFFH
jgi:hypothetical protein